MQFRYLVMVITSTWQLNVDRIIIIHEADGSYIMFRQCP